MATDYYIYNIYTIIVCTGSSILVQVCIVFLSVWQEDNKAGTVRTDGCPLTYINQAIKKSRGACHTYCSIPISLLTSKHAAAVGCASGMHEKKGEKKCQVEIIVFQVI